MNKPDVQVWKSYVWHNDQCYFVSTILRDYDIPAAGGTMRGFETIVWTYQWDTAERGEMIWQAGGLNDHANICRRLIAGGANNLEQEES